MNAKEVTKNLCVIVFGLIILSFMFKIEGLPNKWLIGIASIVGVIGLSSKAAAQKIVATWFKIGNALGWLNSRILLSLIFYLILTPISIVYRILSKDSLQKSKPTNSVFFERNHKYTKRDLENLW